MLLDAFDILPQEAIACVGAGGKTILSWRLAREITARGQRVVMAPTSRILEPILPREAALYLTERPASERVKTLLQRTPCVIIAAAREQPIDVDITADWPPVRPIKLRGLPPAAIDDLITSISAVTWVSEADGAQRRLLKAPAAHEPPIPARATTVIVMAALEGIGRPLDAATVHRPEIFAALAQLSPGDIITPEALSRVLLHPEGGLKNIPAHARVIVALTQRDPQTLHAAAPELIDRLRASHRLDRCVAAALRAEPPVIFHISRLIPRTAGIVLAAGAATRFNNQPKQLLDWGGRTLVEIAVANALAAGLDPVIVVVGAYADQVRAVLDKYPVAVIDNAAWAQGQSTSVKAGLGALPADVAAAVFLPIDQPNLTPHLLRGLINTHLATQRPIVVVSVDGQRTTPTLFHHSLFADILRIEGDRGARPIIDADPRRVAKVEVDAGQVIDIDTAEEYQRWREAKN